MRGFPQLRRSHLVILGWVALLFVVGGGMRLQLLLAKPNFSFGEAISVLAAAGHQREFWPIERELLPPLGTWATAADYQRFLTVEDRWIFGKIGDGLAHADIHPPAYFWLLHIVVVLFGTSATVGPILNLFLYLCTVLAIIAVGQVALKDVRLGIGAAALWSFSPAVIETFCHARQNNIGALSAVLFILVLYRIAEDGRAGWRSYGLLCATTAFGLLSSYLFSFVVLSASLGLFVAMVWRRQWRRILALWGAVVAGYPVAIALHPDFAQSFTQARDQFSVQPYVEALVDSRIDKVVARYASVVFQTPFIAGHLRDRVEQALVAILLALFVVAVAVGLRRVIRDVRDGDDRAKHVLSLCLLVAMGVMVAIHIYLYLSFRVPRHAMSHRHGAIPWVLLCFLPMVAIRWLPSGRGPVIVLLCCFQFSFGELMTHHKVSGWEEVAALPERLRSGRPVVIDSSSRGVLLPSLWYLPPDTPVFAGSRPLLVKTKRKWAPRVREGGHYIQVGRGARFVKQVLGQGRARRVSGRFNSIGTHYEILPLAGKPGKGRKKP